MQSRTLLALGAALLLMLSLPACRAPENNYYYGNYGNDNNVPPQRMNQPGPNRGGGPAMMPNRGGQGMNGPRGGQGQGMHQQNRGGQGQSMHQQNRGGQQKGNVQQNRGQQQNRSAQQNRSSSQQRQGGSSSGHQQGGQQQVRQK